MANPEVEAIGNCIKELEHLDVVTRARVVAYLHSKYFMEAVADAQKKGLLPTPNKKADA